ncbi:unnamed protein product [Clonostachys solani]|uniref:Zn(2)-C6 fungal-type domain-containing protein n=1 Tax=Clonostachys solani TaxID=160281 RepID=A0A9N9Z8H0_9HYPO|nr:unnamed protein product [Clonostachys solani]
MSASAGEKTRFKRTRTGCLKCRVRRRKCDEGKPKCQRCRDGGFDCQYGTRLSFLDKNSLTAPGLTAKPASSSSYSTLRVCWTVSSSDGKAQAQGGSFADEGAGQFVEPGSVTSKQTNKPREDSSASSEPRPQTSDSSAPSTVLTNAADLDAIPRDPEQEPGSALSNPPLALHTSHDPALISESVDARQDFAATPTAQNHETDETSPGNRAYDTALNVLLSLSHPDNSTFEKGIHGGGSGFSLAGSNELASSPGLTVQSSGSLKELFPNCAHLPQSEKIQLIRHYRYNIAPWLDIGDSGQTFGLQVARMASLCPPVLEALLILSSVSLDCEVGREYYPPGTSSQYLSPSDTSVTIDLAAFVLNMTRHHILTHPLAWKRPFQDVNGVWVQFLNSTAASQQYTSINVAAAWVLLRFDLSTGLVMKSPVFVPNILSSGITSPSSRNLSRDMLGYDREPALLCAQVLNLCFHGDTGQPTHIGTVQTWMELSQSLNIWYANRPQDFKPMVELEDSLNETDTNLFPTILFTNAAAVLANQLYHTAMLLLLQNRPRTLSKDAAGRSILVSPLWHAQRVCGISLNNEDRCGWDFCLVASLFLAAQRMTYEPQQNAVLGGFHRIAAITGWNLSGLSEHLSSLWQPD